MAYTDCFNFFKINVMDELSEPVEYTVLLPSQKRRYINPAIVPLSAD